MRIGVLGGGQLGRMLALAGIPLGHRFVFLEPAPDCPASDVGRVVQAPYDDPDGLDELAEASDVVTYEFENVPLDAAKRLGERVEVYPPPEALRVSQDRLLEKRFLRSCGIPTPNFHPVRELSDLPEALRATGLPAVAKLRRMGYDGKGQTLVRSADEAWGEIGSLLDKHGELVLESLVRFDRELSVVAVQGAGGAGADRRFYPLAENRHEGGILRETRAPASRASAGIREKAKQFAGRVLDRLRYRGILAVEFFQTGDALLANEFAPRVHNSGHWTQDGMDVCQFEAHVRAVAASPFALGAATPSAMINLIGEEPALDAVLGMRGVFVHLYGKAPRPGRKLGHVNVCGGDDETVERRRRRVLAALKEQGAKKGTAEPLP